MKEGVDRKWACRETRLPVLVVISGCGIEQFNRCVMEMDVLTVRI
jgi:hypothetical protein